MKRSRFASLFLAITFLAFHCAAKEPPAPRVTDLTTADGIGLKATYFAAGKSGPGVLLLHQCNRQRKVWDGLAKQLALAGVNVLTLDLRGFGESGGTPQAQATPQQQAELQRKWPDDIDVAFQYLKSQPGVTQDVMGVGGASCGVNNSVQTARRHSEVKSLMLLSGSTNRDGRQFLRTSNLPVFFAVADDDEFPPTVEAIEWLYTLTGNPGKDLKHYQTGGHGADMFPVHPELPKEIAAWFVTTLIKTPGHAPIPKKPAPVPEFVKNLDLIDQAGGPAKMEQMVVEARQKDPQAAVFPQQIVTMVGLEHIQSGDTRGAVDILKINAPDSAKTIDLIEEPGGPAKAAQMLAEARQKDPKAILFPQELVNLMGYGYLQSGDTKKAVEIMKLNSAAFPDSPNAYDSLSDAYLADDQKDLARQSAQRALDLLPSDTTDPKNLRDGIKASAEQKLKQLGGAQ